MSGPYSHPLRNYLHFLEDPKHPSVGPNLYFLGFVGLWHPVGSRITKIKQVSFFVAMMFFFSQYAKLLYKLDRDSFKLILQYAPFHMGIVKSCLLQIQYPLWEKLISYISAVECEQMEQNDVEIVKIMNKYIVKNRKVTYFYWAMAFFVNFSIFAEPYQKNSSIKNATDYVYMFDMYTPFDKEPPGCYATMFIQTVLGYMCSVYIVGWDTLVVAIMIFFAGQLMIARVYCLHLIKVKNEKHSHQNIVDFHQFYITLIKYQKLFNILISRVMFVFLIVISMNLGVCIIHIVELRDEFAALIASVTYIIACLIQLLGFYWHSNAVTIESNLVSHAIYQSEWVEASRSLQKEIALLCITTTKRMAFDAGPFNEMSLSVFVAILRASYSFFTLMHGTN